jgi:hypothetical protein
VIASRDTGSLLPAGWSDCEIHPTDKVIRYFGSRELIDGHALAAGRRERNAWSVRDVDRSTALPAFRVQLLLCPVKILDSIDGAAPALASD